MSVIFPSSILPQLFKPQTSAAVLVKEWKSSVSLSKFSFLAVLKFSKMFPSAVSVESVPNNIAVFFFNEIISAVLPNKNIFESGHHIIAVKFLLWSSVE